MSPDTPELRIQAALELVPRLADIVVREGYDGLPWYHRFRGIGAVLSESDRPATERLREAAELLSEMYRGGRNFSDFYIPRQDWQSQKAANEKMSSLVSELRALLCVGESAAT
ncbi:hypothetical protein [Planosporangium mesophilum]|uniref:Uncharacterized protein n=1 Tax=Planosporangium mesophilum TaxID=689768 RepID=A0A8J3X0L8_9ACTN|nr:hypothetical protein [Planosporangium mesophilum]NJC84866.1 hypothetical protein [Planosporangium mesophilum]GII23510.1 hypothetical protein Pme01_31070 [Planosporangium mesophilum]